MTKVLVRLAGGPTIPGTGQLTRTPHDSWTVVVHERTPRNSGDEVSLEVQSGTTLWTCRGLVQNAEYSSDSAFFITVQSTGDVNEVDLTTLDTTELKRRRLA